MTSQQGRSGAVNTGDSSSSPSSSSASTSSTKSGKKRSIEEIVDERLEILSDKIQSKKKRKEGNFKYVSNKDQFEFNEDVLINLREANRSAHSGAKRNIKKAIKKLKKRNKLIKMADKSKAGWKINQEIFNRRGCLRPRRRQKDTQRRKTRTGEDCGGQGKEEEHQRGLLQATR